MARNKSCLLCYSNISFNFPNEILPSSVKVYRDIKVERDTLLLPVVMYDWKSEGGFSFAFHPALGLPECSDI